MLLLILVLRPNGLFYPARQAPPEPLTGTFIAPSRAICVPPWVVGVVTLMAALLPLILDSPYALQTLTNAWLVRDPGA